MKKTSSVTVDLRSDGPLARTGDPPGDSRDHRHTDRPAAHFYLDDYHGAGLQADSDAGNLRQHRRPDAGGGRQSRVARLARQFSEEVLIGVRHRIPRVALADALHGAAAKHFPLFLGHL